MDNKNCEYKVKAAMEMVWFVCRKDNVKEGGDRRKFIVRLLNFKEKNYNGFLVQDSCNGS
jgi:hypothetical protein